jgi:N-methylhydantoinase B
MQNALFRTGYSTVIRESQDASCALLDARGRLAAQHVVLALHMGAFPAAVAGTLARYPAETMRPGDAFIVNHPYEGGVPHAPDMVVITPVFFADGLVAFSASMAHKSDIGGPVPGSCSGQAQETYNEGIHFPPVRYERAGRRDEAIDRILAANSRTPEVVLGDLHGQVGACRLGERRLAEALRKYGADAVLGASDRLMTATEARVRAAIATWRDGAATAERFVDDDGVELGKPVRIRVTVRKTADHISFDLRESADQTRGPANVRPPLVRAACAFVLISLIDRYLAVNDGVLRVVELQTRPGSVTDPRPPAPVNTYNPTMHAIADALFEALSHLAPDRAQADGSGSRSIFIGGHDAGRAYLLYELFGGGSGARRGLDGVSGTSVNHTNTKIAPIEIIESEFPVRIERFALIPDSGGAGEHRGGLGFVRQYELLAESARFSLRSTKHTNPPRGMAGGDDGRGGRCVAYADTPKARDLPTRLGDLPLVRGDRVRLETPGGGGYGDPLRRDPEAVRADVLDGYVTLAAARERYGVALSPGGAVDLAATAELRRARAATAR